MPAQLPTMPSRVSDVGHDVPHDVCVKDTFISLVKGSGPYDLPPRKRHTIACDISDTPPQLASVSRTAALQIPDVLSDAPRVNALYDRFAAGSPSSAGADTSSEEELSEEEVRNKRLVALVDSTVFKASCKPLILTMLEKAESGIYIKPYKDIQKFIRAREKREARSEFRNKAMISSPSALNRTPCTIVAPAKDLEAIIRASPSAMWIDVDRVITYSGSIASQSLSFGQAMTRDVIDRVRQELPHSVSVLQARNHAEIVKLCSSL